MATKYESYLLNSSAEIAVTTDPVTTTDLPLSANNEPNLTLSGVVDNGTAGVSYAKVTLTDGTTPVTVYTDTNGYYSIEVLSTATYSITVSKTGFENVTQSGITILADTSEVLDVTLTALAGTGNMIYGIVTDTETPAVPIEEALVTIVNSSNEVVQFTQTNADGEYAAYGLDNAIYTVIVSKSGSAAEVASVELTALIPIVENNEALAASPASGTGSISGIITDDEGSPAPIADAWVGLYTVVAGDETLSQATLTGTSGAYIFTSLSAGTYVIKSKKIESMT